MWWTNLLNAPYASKHSKTNCREMTIIEKAIIWLHQQLPIQFHLKEWIIDISENGNSDAGSEESYLEWNSLNESHFGELPNGKINCLICDKILGCMRSFTRHFKSAHQINQPVSCPLCQSTFKNRRSRYCHYKIVHKLSTEAMKQLENKWFSIWTFIWLLCLRINLECRFCGYDKNIIL